jgi:hypothetical protein
MSFAGSLRHGGVLVFDVRDWKRSAERMARNAVSERRIDTPHGLLSFRSDTRLDLESQRLLIRERFEIDQCGRKTVEESDFVMACWSPKELEDRLKDSGFVEATYFTSYGDDGSGWVDRIVCVAIRAEPRA